MQGSTVYVLFLRAIEADCMFPDTLYVSKDEKDVLNQLAGSTAGLNPLYKVRKIMRLDADGGVYFVEPTLVQGAMKLVEVR